MYTLMLASPRVKRRRHFSVRYPNLGCYLLESLRLERCVGPKMSEQPAEPSTPTKKKKRELSEEERQRAYFMLKGMLIHHGSLPNGSFKKVATQFGCDGRTISALWKHTQKNETLGLSNSPAIRSNRHKRGRKPLYDPEAIVGFQLQKGSVK